MDFAFWLSLAVFLLAGTAFADLALGWRKLGYLRDVAAAGHNAPPSTPRVSTRVSIIIAALNEAATIEPALRSVLAQDCPDLEVIAINDRSSDMTGEILERIGNTDNRLRVLHITDLPAGWLGKNHALHQGALLARGEYLLFTDADVVFAPSALRRAVAHCEAHRLDHLAVLPEVPARGLLMGMMNLGGMVGGFGIMKPWKVRTSQKHFFGVGAFNLVRARSYRETGGHEAIALAVVDDMILAKRMKKPGFRQDFLLGNGLISVEIYHSVGEMVRGMRKNIFAAFGFKLRTLIALTAVTLIMLAWPWIGLVATEGVTRWINAATLIVSLALHLDVIRFTKYSRWCLVFQPIAGLFALFVAWQASLIVLYRGEVVWRGTRYSLEELKRAQY